MPKVALITGATGIVGSAIIEQLLQTKNSEWSKVIAVSRRKPTLSVDDPRLVFLPIDLELSEEEILSKLKEGGAADATHVFFTAYIHDKNWDANNLYNKNVPIFTKFIKAVDSLASGLERIELQTGGKYYGIHLGWNGKVIEDDSPRYTPEPNKPDFYFGQEDFLAEFQKGKKWKYTIYRPLTITGITRGNGMSFGVTLAIYFAIQKYLGKKALYPGNEVNYKGTFEFSNADVIAKFAIWASLLPGAENEGFLIIDHNSKKATGEDFWKACASYFGVEVEEPTFPKTSGLPKGSGHYQVEWSLAEYMKDKKEIWKEIAQKYRIDENTFDYATWEFADAEFAFTWPQHFTMQKAMKLGWKGEQEPILGLTQTFDRMKHWKMIPNF